MSDDRTGQSKSWLERLTQAFSDEPRTREDLLDLLLNAKTEGLLDQDAYSIIEGAIQVSEMKVRDVMIPRSQMVAVEANQTPREFLPVIISSAHSRFPVLGESPDEIIGILLAKDLLPLLLEDNEAGFDLYSKLRKATVIPESKRLNVLLKEFRLNRNHMAIVVDEYGGIAGLITIEDVLEQIVGEIEDEHDIEEDDGNIRPFDENAYIVKALTEIEDFNEHFGTTFSKEEFDTIGGIVAQRFGHLPRKDEEIDIANLRFKVLSSDNRRIRLLQVTRL